MSSDNVPDVYLSIGLNDIPPSGVPDHHDNTEAILLLPPDQLLHAPVANWSPSPMSLCRDHGADHATELVLARCQLSIVLGPSVIIVNNVIGGVDIQHLLHRGARHG